MKKKAFELIKEFFGASNTEIMKLEKGERTQLASGIARHLGLAPESCEFELAAY